MFEFISASGGSPEAMGVSEAVSVRDGGSRPETGRRPGSSRSARSVTSLKRSHSDTKQGGNGTSKFEFSP